MEDADVLVGRLQQQLTSSESCCYKHTDSFIRFQSVFVPINKTLSVYYVRQEVEREITGQECCKLLP